MSITVKYGPTEVHGRRMAKPPIDVAIFEISKQLKRIEDRQTEMFVQLAKVHLLVLVGVITDHPDLDYPQEMIDKLAKMIDELDV